MWAGGWVVRRVPAAHSGWARETLRGRNGEIPEYNIWYDSVCIRVIV
jgi:hypothetical protein